MTSSEPGRDEDAPEDGPEDAARDVTAASAREPAEAGTPSGGASFAAATPAHEVADEVADGAWLARLLQWSGERAGRGQAAALAAVRAEPVPSLPTHDPGLSQVVTRLSDLVTRDDPDGGQAPPGVAREGWVRAAGKLVKEDPRRDDGAPGAAGGGASPPEGGGS